MSPTVIMVPRAPRKRGRLARVLIASAALLALSSVAAAVAIAGPAPQTAPGDPIDPRTYAPNSKLFLVTHAVGVQKYTCQPNGTWLFTDPEAVLYAPSGNPIGTHFLNFATGRPTWQLRDGSSVEATRFATMPGGPGNIAWLLLQAAATTAGPDGDRLAGTTWVQRLNTSGGATPTEACAAGDTKAVPYTTDYMFWKAAGS